MEHVENRRLFVRRMKPETKILRKCNRYKTKRKVGIKDE